MPIGTSSMTLAQSGCHDPFDISPQDALICVDLQNDLVPEDDINPKGGAFAVPEGAVACAVSNSLIRLFAEAGATVVAARDYHPANHCCFQCAGGPLPEHCLQGSVGSFFYKTTEDALVSVFRRHLDGEIAKRPVIVFKGFSEDADSLGAFPYSEKSAHGRISVSERCKYPGCAVQWTGASCLKCSSLLVGKEIDVNAPPDVLSFMHRASLGDRLRDEGITRLFVVGLALDSCVLDTACNAHGLDLFEEIYIVLDASRPYHSPGIGFLTPVESFVNKTEQHEVRLCSAAALGVSRPRLHGAAAEPPAEPGCWSEQHSALLRADAIEDCKAVPQVKVLDSKELSSVKTATNHLTTGKIQAEGGACVVFSATTGEWFVLYRSDKKHEVLTLLAPFMKKV